MVRALEPLVVEFDADNRNVQFPPLNRKVRGRFSFTRTGLPGALRLMTTWGGTIPGQMVALDADAHTARLIEPLHEADWVQPRRAVEARGNRLEPPEQGFRDIHVGTWCFWLRRCVESGLARIVAGAFPEKTGEPRLGHNYRISAASATSGDLAAENQDLRTQLAELRQSVADLRAIVGGKK